ncbi:MAG TPA: hypothetical protein VN812_18390 [Candidatus Acidoferrales bacterium]|nr:hypothetical protein [Candidatus Acidoferrales bacterium]
MSARSRRIVLVMIVLHAAVLLSPTRAVELGPQGVVREFCQLDGMGQRVSILGWQQIAPLVSWSLEPAWDHVVLISGYAVGPFKPGEGGTPMVGVDYTDVGQVSAFGFDTAAQLETLRFELQPTEAGRWRINGPPPPPHIFADRADIEAMRRSFEEGGLNFIPNALFVWRTMRTEGWDVPFERTTDLPSGPGYRVVDEPAVGDVVLYLRDGDPYHAGLLAADNQVVSSTLNGGIVHTPLATFTGEVSYLRLARADRLPIAEVPTQAPAVTTPAARPTPVARALDRAPAQQRTPASRISTPRVLTPRVSKHKRKRQPPSKPVKKPGRKTKASPHPMPVAACTPR